MLLSRSLTSFSSTRAFSPALFCRFASSSLSSVGVIGVGQIGTQVCHGLIRKGGHKIKAFDLQETNRKDLENVGVEWKTSAKEAAEGVDLLITALPAPKHVRHVMEEDQGGLLDTLKEGTMWIDHTTTEPDEVTRLHEKGKSKGLEMLEAPLTGGYALLVGGMMTVLVGGSEETLAKAEPLMKSYAATILHMGDAGSASTVKIITNQLAGLHMIAAGEATMLAKKAGVKLDAFFDGVRASAGNSYVFETETPLIFNGSYDPGFAISLHCKDLDIGSRLGKKLGVPLDLFGMTEQMYQRAMARYGPDAGSSHPARMIEDDLKTSLRVPGFEHWTYKIEKVTGGSIGVVHLDKRDKK